MIFVAIKRCQIKNKILFAVITNNYENFCIYEENINVLSLIFSYKLYLEATEFYLRYRCCIPTTTKWAYIVPYTNIAGRLYCPNKVYQSAQESLSMSIE